MLPTTAGAVSVNLDPNLEKRLNDLALKTNQTKDSIIEQALYENLDDLADYYLALEISERIKRGEERTYTLEEIEKELNLNDTNT